MPLVDAIYCYHCDNDRRPGRTAWYRDTDPDECPECGMSRFFCPDPTDSCCGGCEDYFDPGYDEKDVPPPREVAK